MKKILSLLLVGSALFAEPIVLSGSVISDNQKMITSRYMGFVTKLNVSDGSHVKKGDLLYSIDSKEVDSTKTQVGLGIAQAQISLQMYQNQYNNVKLNLDRNKRLLEKDMVSKYDVEKLELATKNLKDMVDISQKQVDDAKARLDQVNNQYQYLNIKAPNDGVIVSTNVKVGEMAMPGMPAIVLSDLSDLKISVEVAESDLQRFPYNSKVIIEIPSMGLKTEGKIDAVIPNSNPMTHSFKIKVSFKNSQGVVYPGMYATVTTDDNK